MQFPSVRELVGDAEVLDLVFDGFLGEWGGVYTILPSDSDDYIFDPVTLASEFCRTVRATAKGNKLCLDCDKHHAAQAMKAGRPIHYHCHAGLLNLAAPVFVNGRCLATLLLGQWLPLADEALEMAAKVLPQYEATLHLALVDSWLRTEPIEETAVADLKRHLEKLAAYLAREWRARVELVTLRQTLQYQLDASRKLQSAFLPFNQMPASGAELWKRTETALEAVRTQFEARCALVLEVDESTNGIPTVKAIAGLPTKMRGAAYPKDKEALSQLLTNRSAVTKPTAGAREGSVSWHVAQSNPANMPDKVAMVPLYWGTKDLGALYLFVDEASDTRHSLPIEEELGILEPFTKQISFAYESYRLLQAEKDLVALRTEWVQDVVHEVLQPINGVLGYASRWHERLDALLEGRGNPLAAWTYANLEALHNALECIEGMATDAERVAHIFAWVAAKGASREQPIQKVDDDLPGTLIACARDKQGQARERNQISLHVKSETLTPFSGRVELDRNLFMRAMWNLLDNAVKYSAPRTTIFVTGVQSGPDLIIRVKNQGLPVREGEEEIIFQKYRRSPLVEERGFPGTGVGLAHARAMIELQGGTVRTSPSTLVRRGSTEEEDVYETVFEVVLPLINSQKERRHG